MYKAHCKNHRTVTTGLSAAVHLATLVVNETRLRMLKEDRTARRDLSSEKDHQCLTSFEIHCFKPTLLSCLLSLNPQILAEVRMYVR